MKRARLKEGQIKLQKLKIKRRTSGSIYSENGLQLHMHSNPKKRFKIKWIEITECITSLKDSVADI
mgnify:FL=1